MSSNRTQKELVFVEVKPKQNPTKQLCSAVQCFWYPVFQELHERQPEDRRLCEVPARKHCLRVYLPRSEDTGGERTVPLIPRSLGLLIEAENKTSLPLPFRFHFLIVHTGFYSLEQQRKRFKKSA